MIIILSLTVFVIQIQSKIMCGIFCLIQAGGIKIDIQAASICLTKLYSRGPEACMWKIIDFDDNIQIFIGFTRLAIMDQSDDGMQPFSDSEGNILVCNGEIYNYKELKKNHNLHTISDSDCEILLPMIKKIGFDECIKDLDAEFALIFFDKIQGKISVGRDRYGVRPLYQGYNEGTKTYGFASELKALDFMMETVEQVNPCYITSIDLTKLSNNDTSCTDICEFISTKNFTHYYQSNIPETSMINTSIIDTSILNSIQQNINTLLTNAVKKRLRSDRQIGFLLSGGLDSSLIVAIAAKLIGIENIVCFSIGVEGSPDIIAAKKVVEFLGIQNHHIIPFDVKEGISMIPEVIRIVETYDITTIRASTPQYIMAKYIKENTKIRVLFSGEGSDEIHGSYRYFRDAPNPQQFHDEVIRLLSELYYFDNKRTDRTMAAWGLEVRVPFLDNEYVKYVTELDPRLFMYKKDYMEKMLVRNSFRSCLPDEILYRSKEAFSDAVSNTETNWAKTIQIVAESKITIDELNNNTYTINKPKTIDALYFRKIFDLFYNNRCSIIPHYWLPKFQKQDIYDPSATILPCY